MSGLVFCDISSAFDRVWHRGFLHKLHNIGFQGKFHAWFHDYFLKVISSLWFKENLPLGVKYKAGVPQGSVLGPLLFLVYINDLPEIIESNIRLFADDTTIFTVVDDKVTNPHVNIGRINGLLHLIPKKQSNFMSLIELMSLYPH